MRNNQDKIKPTFVKPIEYLVIGHVTADITDSGTRLGGTSTFAGLTARMLGLQSGIVTSFSDDLDITPIDTLWIKNKASKFSTTFKNVSDGVHRTQYLFHTAKNIDKNDMPKFDPPPAIVHLGPVANEVDPNILKHYPHSLKCLTPQGWFRETNTNDQILFNNWEDFEQHLGNANIAIISQEDVQNNEEIIAKMASSIAIFVVTENYKGARVYWHNDARFINAPEVEYVDDTGAGDIFAAAFFCRYLFTKDPWEAGRFATLLASWSVTREYLHSIPTLEEIKQAKTEVLNY